MGGRLREYRVGTKPGEPNLTLMKIDLWEVSIVTFPANPKARISTVKTLTVDEWRDFEANLCDAGLSRSHARLAVARFKGLRQCEAGELGHALREAVAPAMETQTDDAQVMAGAVLDRIMAACIVNPFA